MIRRTKIICTLGPATDKPGMVEKLMKSGMNVARLNFSHGSHAEQKVRMDMVKETRTKLGYPCGIMLDTRGPEIRIKTFEEGRIELEDGDIFTLTTRDVVGTKEIVGVTYEGLPGDVAVGTQILIDDGLIAFEVLEIKDGTDIVCRTLNAGALSNRKSVNVPGAKLSMPYLSDSDKADIIFGCEQQVEFIAASFARNAEDMRQLKALLADHGGEKIQIIAKIENMEGINNLDEILEEVDGIMVARGDLGVEVSYNELPELQKGMIKKAISTGKRVVTATQMLESMTKNPRPTRAEVSDVANAVFDGSSAIMLSGETANGKYPVEALETMSTIAMSAEKTIHYERRRVTRDEFKEMRMRGNRKSNAIAHATCTTSNDLGAVAIVAFTASGETARAVSSFRPGTPVIGATPVERTFHQMSMSWGIIPCMSTFVKSGTELYTQAIRAAVHSVGAKEGDIITVTAGMPVGRVSYTNTLRLIELQEAHVKLAYEDESPLF